MKILFCDNALDSFLNFRGAVIQALIAEGHKGVLAVPRSAALQGGPAQIPEGLDVRFVDMAGTGSNPFSDLRYMRSLKTIMRTEKPDVVFTYTIKPNVYGSLAAHSLKIPSVAMVAGLGYAFAGNTWKHRLGRALLKAGLRKARRVIVLNDSNRRRLLEDGFVTPGRIILFPGGEGVDTAKYTFTEDVYATPRFLMVARVLYDKGYTEYVEAARMVKANYPQAIFDLLGPMAEESPMGVPGPVVEAHCREGVINYLGETTDVIPYVKQPGVVEVLVSSYHEGFNRSLMEACAMGRVCISSDIPGCREIIQHGHNGLQVPPKDPRALARAMTAILEMPATERQSMAKAGRSLAESRFDINRVIDNYREIISGFGI